MPRLTLTLFALLLVSGARAQERRFSDEEYEQRIHKLELAMGVLKEIGDEGGLEVLRTAADKLRAGRKEARGRGERAEQENPEIAWAKNEIRALRLAEKAWAEKDRADAAELCRRAYRGMEMRLEGRNRDEIAQETKGAPELGGKVELLLGASRLYREWDMPDRADITGEMGEKLRDVLRQRQARKSETPGNEADLVRRQIKALDIAADAWRERGNERAAKMCVAAGKALKLQLEGRRDPEAREIIADAPSRGNRVELIVGAGNLFAEWGHEEKAVFLKETGERLMQEHGGDGERAESGEAGERIEKSEQLQRRLRELERQMKELRAAMRGLGRKDVR